MNFNKIIAFAAFGVTAFTSCKDTLNVQAPYKDITVVYGLMDQNDAVHYIRINKGFEGNGNAYTMANQYDSIYYPVNNITAVLEDSNPNTDAVVNIIKLDTTTTVALGPGTFSNPKQLLYYTTATLNPNDYYNIVINNSKIGKTIRGSTYLLSDLSFAGAFGSNSNFFTFGSIPYPSAVAWQSSATAQVYQMVLLFYYDKQIGSGSSLLQAPLQLTFAQQTASTSSGGEQMEYEISCQQLFTLITASLKAQPGVNYHADSVGVIFTSGTYDLGTYIQLSQPPEGINQDVPSFSDVTNGIGLYTARHIQTFYRQIDKSTIDSLQGLDQEPRFFTLGFKS